MTENTNTPTPEELAALAAQYNAEPEPRFRFLSIEDLANLPDPSWLVDGWVPDHGLAVQFGPSGSMKSFVAIDWSLCIAAGVPWHGHDVQQGNVVYAALEGARGLHKRIVAWLNERPDAAPHGGFHVVGQPINLRDGDDPDVLIAEAREAFGDDVRLVVVDTMSRSLQGGDENSPTDVGALIAACDRIAQALGCTVLLVHHTGHTAERERGHSSLMGAAEVRIGVKRTGSRVFLTQPKAKDFEESEDVELQVRTVGDSLVLDWIGARPTPKALPDDRDDQCRTAILDVLAKTSQPMSENAVKQAVNVELSSDRKAELLNRLVADGHVTRQMHGRAKMHTLPTDPIPGIVDEEEAA